jgi:hypothetical protein
LDIANGEFTANQRGTIRIKLASDPRWEVPDVPITLTDIIYAPKLKLNLLSVGRMTNSDVNVYFGKHLLWLSLSGRIIAYGSKENNLYTYVGLPIPPKDKMADYVSAPSDPMLWRYRLVHTSHHTIENMRKLQMATNFHPGVHHGPLPQCVNCPYGKQTHVPFQKVEKPPSEIGDLVTSDLCGPFEPSVGNYRYFVTWIDVTTMSFRPPISGLRHWPPSLSTFSSTLPSLPSLHVTSSVSDPSASITPCAWTPPDRHRAARIDECYAGPLGPWTPLLL